MADPMPVMPARLPKMVGVGALLSAVWNRFRSNAKTLILVALLPSLVSFALSILGGTAFFSLGGGVTTAILGGLILGLVLVIIQFWGQAALLVAVTDSSASIASSYTRAWNVFLSYVWVVILSGIIAGGATLLFIIPGIIFAIWMSLAAYVFMVEKVRGLDALAKSREYIRGYSWAVLGRLIVIGLLYIVISAIVSAITKGIVAPMGVSPANAQAIVSAILNLFFSPIMAIYFFLMYEDLKKIKGSSLAIAPATRSLFKTFAWLALIGGVIIFAFLFTRGPASFTPASLDYGELQQELQKALEQSGASSTTTP